MISPFPFAPRPPSSFRRRPMPPSMPKQDVCTSKVPEDTCCRKEEVETQEEEKPLFELFGMHFFTDDILIVVLLFLLYQDGCDDISLYIALVLLLLS